MSHNYPKSQITFSFENVCFGVQKLNFDLDPYGWKDPKQFPGKVHVVKKDQMIFAVFRICT